MVLQRLSPSFHVLRYAGMVAAYALTMTVGTALLIAGMY
jgi:hypothetical protein